MHNYVAMICIILAVSIVTLTLFRNAPTTQSRISLLCLEFAYTKTDVEFSFDLSLVSFYLFDICMGWI